MIRRDISVGILIGPENVGRYFEKACRYFDSTGTAGSLVGFKVKGGTDYFTGLQCSDRQNIIYCIDYLHISIPELTMLDEVVILIDDLYERCNY